MWTSYFTQYKGNQSDFWEVKVIRDDIISGVECGGHQDKQNVRRKKCRCSIEKSMKKPVNKMLDLEQLEKAENRYKIK